MISWQGQMGLASETVYGTPVTPSRYIDVENGNSEASLARVTGESARGTRWQYRDEKTGTDYAYNWELWASPTHIGEQFFYALGAVASVVLTGAEYEHTFTPFSSLTSFTLSVDRAIGASPTFQLAGCKINTLTLENTARDILRTTVEGFGQKNLWAAALSPADADYPSIRPFQFKDLAYSQAFGGSGLSSDTTVERFMVTITNNLINDKVSATGTEYIAALPEGILEVTGSFDKEFESQADFNNFIADAQLDMVATWTGPSMGTNNYLLTLDLPNARITSLPLPQIAGTSERGMYTVEFRALYYVTDTRVMALILNNLVTSYS